MTRSLQSVRRRRYSAKVAVEQVDEANEEGESIGDNLQQQQNDESKRKPLDNGNKSARQPRCPRVSRDTIFAALSSNDVAQMLQIARTAPTPLDVRGRVRTTALRNAINTRVDWIGQVQRTHARLAFESICNDDDDVADE
jgi:hypothetical protein